MLNIDTNKLMIMKVKQQINYIKKIIIFLSIFNHS